MLVPVLVFILCLLVGWAASLNFSSKDDRVLVEGFDGRKYLVRDIPNKKDTADMMALLNAKVLALIHQMRQSGEKPVMVTRLAARYRPEVLAEGHVHRKLTSYTVNKGENVVLCMRSRDADVLYPENVLFSVLLHELAHVSSISEGHGDEFNENLRSLTRAAERAGLLQREKVSLDYCGVPLMHI
jgi:hypothetical protein